jgi:hypothetical protein
MSNKQSAFTNPADTRACRNCFMRQNSIVASFTKADIPASLRDSFAAHIAQELRAAAYYHIEPLIQFVVPLTVFLCGQFVYAANNRRRVTYRDTDTDIQTFTHIGRELLKAAKSHNIRAKPHKLIFDFVGYVVHEKVT